MLFRHAGDDAISKTKSDRPPQNPQMPQRSTSGDCSSHFGVHSRSDRETPSANGVFVGTPVSNESSESREDRLRRIRQDVDDGKYDSDELLEQALEILLKRISSSTE
jgi:hypothetical protein